MKTPTIHTMLKNAGGYLSAVCLLIITSCNVDVKKGDAGTVDSNMESGISIQVVKDGDTLVGKKEETVQHIDRPADSTDATRKNNNK